MLLGALAFARAEAAAAQAADAGVPAEEEHPDEAGVRQADPSAPPNRGAEPAEAQSAPGAGPGLFERSVAEASPAAAAAPPASVALGGYVRGDVFAGKVTGFRQGDIKADYGELALIARGRKEALGDAFAEVRLRYGMQGEPQPDTAVDVREAFVNTYLGPLDLRLGKQIIVWGRADLLNPTNNLTPFDFRVRSPIEDDRRIGNVGARAFLRLAPFRLEGVWLPVYEPTQLPQVPLPQYVAYGSPSYPKPELDRGLLAGRMHLELPAVEMSVSYLHGYAPLPGLALTSVTIDPQNPQVLIARTAYRQQVLGFDFSTALGNVIAIRGEAAYRRPYDYKDLINAPRPDLQYALGVDHTFGSLSVIAQYLGRYTFDWQKESGPVNPPDPSTIKTDFTFALQSQAETVIDSQLRKTNQILFAQTERIQHLATVRLEWLLAHDTLSLSALGLVNVTTKEWLASPRLGYRISDALVAYLGAEILTGPTGTLFGLVDQLLSAGYLELRCTF